MPAFVKQGTVAPQEARYYHKKGKAQVACVLCPRGCEIEPGERGECLIRENKDGTLYAIAYNRISSLQLDPIEKKPLYHFFPGTKIISIGAIGCNLKCLFCQNWHMVEGRIPLYTATSEDIIRSAVENESIGIAYTYNEPLIWFEFVLDTAKKAREAGLKNVLVTNGYINPRPLKELLPYIDAMNIDLKSIREEFYRKMCDGHLAPVQKTIQAAKKTCHVELTNLIVTNKNDSREDLEGLISWAASLGRNTVLHFSRYFPQYKLKEPQTPEDTLLIAYRMARKQLDYVYLGNIWSEEGSHTYCPQCRTLLIRRYGYDTDIVGLTGSRCARCNYETGIMITEGHSPKIMEGLA